MSQKVSIIGETAQTTERNNAGRRIRLLNLTRGNANLTNVFDVENWQNENVDDHKFFDTGIGLIEMEAYVEYLEVIRCP